MAQRVGWWIAAGAAAVLAGCAPGPSGGSADTPAVPAAMRPLHGDSAVVVAEVRGERVRFEARMGSQLDSIDGQLTAMEADLRRGATEARIATVEDLRRVHRLLAASLSQADSTSPDDWPRFAVGFVTTLRALRRGMDQARVMDLFSETRRTATL